MNYFFRVLLFLGLVGVSTAHYFIKLVILAGLGLAGLWMVNNIVQNYNKNPGNGGGSAPKFFTKRSVNNMTPLINWELVMSRDPASCVRSFVCQLAAQHSDKLDKTERIILKMSRDSAEGNSRASKQLNEALKYGQEVQNQVHCRKFYKLCPYSSQTMAALLRLFSN